MRSSGIDSASAPASPSTSATVATASPSGSISSSTMIAACSRARDEKR
jgi:hypothetical protein